MNKTLAVFGLILLSMVGMYGIFSTMITSVGPIDESLFEYEVQVVELPEDERYIKFDKFIDFWISLDELPEGDNPFCLNKEFCR